MPAHATIEVCPVADLDAALAELADYREAYRKTIEDECPSDEKHCACVPFLRSEIKRISDECDEGRCPSAEHERLAALARVAALTAALDECAEYFDSLADVDDGPDGQPVPNLAMRMQQLCDRALKGGA